MKLEDTGPIGEPMRDVVNVSRGGSSGGRFRFVRGALGPALLVVLGVGIGIAVSVAVKSTPVNGIAAQGDQPGAISQLGGAGAGGKGKGTAGGKGGSRYVTVGGSAGTNGSSTSGQTIAGQQGTSGSGGGGGGGGGSADSTAGVTSSQIKVAANIVTDGTGASFLGEAINGIRAVFNQANVKGINGRKINLVYRNDSWDASKGLQYIQSYIDEKYFALAVNPSSQGLDAAVQNGTIDNAGIPVVGTDGMLISQYRWPTNGNGPGLARWVWPVASSTVSTMHIIADYSKSHYNAQTFGLVYDNQYKFGVEGATAFQKQLETRGVSDSNIHEQGIDPGQTSYTNDANTFNKVCGANKCDVVALLLDPGTALTWIKSGGTFGGKATMGPQTLFNHNFASNCVTERKQLGQTCHDFIVWTGYNPPVGALANQSDVAKYVSDVHSVDPQADVENSFTEGAYLGAKVFVAGLQKAGPNLTRDSLRQALDSMTYSSGLSKDLTWTPSSHFANTAMRAFVIGISDQGFTGWQDANAGWVQDSRVGQY